MERKLETNTFDLEYLKKRNEELERTKEEENNKAVVMDEIPRSGKPRSRRGKKSKGTGTTLDLEATKDNESAENATKVKTEEDKPKAPAGPVNDGLESLPFLDDDLLDLDDNTDEDPNPFARHRAAEVLPSAGNPMLAGRAGGN